MRRLFLSILFLSVIFLSFIVPVSAEEQVTAYLFWAKGCPHCQKEKIFLSKVGEKYPQLIIKQYDVTASQEGLNLMKQFGEQLSADVSGVPFFVIGNQYISGYYDDQTTGKKIEELIACKVEDNCNQLTAQREDQAYHSSLDQKKLPETISLPFVGQLKLKNLSLPALTFFVALLDGFNPCAMWTLMFLIGLLLGMKDRRRMWLLGTAFIVSSALVYFLFLSAWLNFFLFLGFVVWVRIAIGLLAFAAGVYYLYDYIVNKSGVCKITGGKKKQKVFASLKKITQKEQLIVALIGIVLLAFAVNLVELICSAGLPAVYTQILSLSNLPRWQYYLYLIFYIIIFMADDLFVFFTAMKTLHAVGIDSKYSRYSHLIGGVFMLLIGVLMLFKPEILMFG